MKCMRDECPRQRTNTYLRSDGQINICVGMFLFSVVFLVIVFGVKILQFQVVGAYVEDGIAAANLASAVIDVEEYGKSHNIVISSPERAYVRFADALRYNLRLSGDYYSMNTEMIHGQVEILEYQIFNVTDRNVQVFSFDGNGNLTNVEMMGLEHAYLPDGNKVVSTSVYSKLGFWVMGLYGEPIYATKEKGVDIVDGGI